MVHNTRGGGQYNVAKLTGRQQVCDPLFDGAQFDVKTRADHAAFVDSASKINYNFARAMVVHNFKLPNVS